MTAIYPRFTMTNGRPHASLSPVVCATREDAHDVAGRWSS